MSQNISRLLIVLSLIWFLPAKAEDFSMRRCLLLPVTDTAGHSLGFQVYESLEAYLKEAKWCDYVSSAELIEVFSKYREGLEAHLKDENVLRTVAQRMRVGSIIRLDLDYDVNQVKATLDVLGENGRDIYFSEKEVIDAKNPDQIIQAAKNWLELYETSIPYDGKVLGVLGDQITFSYPKNSAPVVGQEFRIRRLTGKSKHPLLKKVVEWDTEAVAKGEVFNISNDQALGNIKIYERATKVQPGDWVVIEEYTAEKAIEDVSQAEVKANQFGKLGFVTLTLDVGSSSVGTNAADNNKATGFTYGFSAEVEAWITREYFVMGEISRRLGTLEEESGSLALDTINITSGVYKVGGGYKFLPLGFFYGPQINLMAGYANYTYDVEESAQDGFGKNSISGFFVGVGGNMPLQKGIRVFGKAEFIPFSKFTDEDDIFGSEKSSSSLVFKGGLKYQYSPLLSLDAALEVQNNSAKFDSGDISQVSYRDSIFKLGGSFIF